MLTDDPRRGSDPGSGGEARLPISMLRTGAVRISLGAFFERTSTAFAMEANSKPARQKPCKLHLLFLLLFSDESDTRCAVLQYRIRLGRQSKRANERLRGYAVAGADAELPGPDKGRACIQLSGSCGVAPSQSGKMCPAPGILERSKGTSK